VQAYFAEFHHTLLASTSVQSTYRQLIEAAPKKRASLMRTYVQEMVAQTLQSTQFLAADVGFSDLGMDSLMAIELRRRLEKGLQMAIPSTIAFEYPTIDALAGFLLRKLGEQQAELLALQTDQPLQPAPDTAVNAIAIPVEPTEERTDEELVETKLRRLEALLKGQEYGGTHST
jgi:acyl carrier protein